MRIKETKVYTFEELDNTAKERAREWLRRCEGEMCDWAEFVIEDAARMAEILGIEIQTREVKLMGGSTRRDPVIYWQLHVQGPGACFSGRYRYAKGAVEKIKAETSDGELMRIAKVLQDAQKTCFYRAVMDITARDRSMTIDCEEISGHADKETQESIEGALEAFARWVYKQLDGEWEYRMSDECIEEGIKANEYEFDEQGRRT